MSKFNLIGQHFGRLSVVERIGYKHPNKKHVYWLCHCECGGVAEVSTSVLRNGESASCGCLHKEVARMGKNNLKHGCTRGGKPIPEYSAWAHAKERCFNPKVRNYSSYGGRGITMCERWAKDFAAFSADMGPRPSPQHSLDRKDNDGDYEPDNCQWATRKHQNQNQRRIVPVIYQGREIILTDLARELGINYSSLRHFHRISGLSIEEAIAKARKCSSVA